MNPAPALQSFAIGAAGVETALAPALTFTIPLADSAEFGLLAESRRTEVQLGLRLLERVHLLHAQKNFVGQVNALATAYRHHRGLSGVSLRKKYSAYVTSNGDWRTLVKGYKAPSTQPGEFVQFVQKLAEENHRSIDAAVRKLREVVWASGQVVPGYGTWMEFFLRKHPEQALPKKFPRVYPEGWSARNLRRYAPSKAARTLFQRGIGAARAHFPSVKRDPSQLRPMELITIDDFELDTMCVFRGDAERKLKPQIAYVAGLLAIDVATRRKLAWGIGPKLDREEKQSDGSTRTIRGGITAASVQGLLHQLFERHGLPDYPITILCENATASISADLELSLATLFDGRVRIERTGMLDHKTLTNGFAEHGGKPNEKGWIEAEFNYLWNQMADSPGYKGSNERLNAPAGLEEMKKYTKLLIGQGARALNLPPEVVADLALPFYSPEELERAFEWNCVRADMRTQHRFLGFDRITEFRLEKGEAPRPFSHLALLPPEAQLGAELVERMEAPLERWERLSQQHPRSAVKPATLALFFLTPKSVTFQRNQITFTHQGRGYTYVDSDGSVFTGVADGTKFLAYFDPKSPLFLHLSTLTCAYAGKLRLLGGRPDGVDIRDEDALAKAGGMRAAIVQRTVNAVLARHGDENAALHAMRTHNDALIAAHKAPTTLPPVASSTAPSLTTAQHTGIAERESTAEPLAATILGATVATEQQEQANATKVTRALRRAKNATASFLDHCTPPAAAKPASGPAKEFSTDDLL